MCNSIHIVMYSLCMASIYFFSTTLKVGGLQCSSWSATSLPLPARSSSFCPRALLCSSICSLRAWLSQLRTARERRTLQNLSEPSRTKPSPAQQPPPASLREEWTFCSGSLHSRRPQPETSLRPTQNGEREREQVPPAAAGGERQPGRFLHPRHEAPLCRYTLSHILPHTHGPKNVLFSTFRGFFHGVKEQSGVRGDCYRVTEKNRYRSLCYSFHVEYSRKIRKNTVN